MSIEGLVSSFFKVREDLHVYGQTRLAAFQVPRRCSCPTSVVCDRLIANRARLGDLDLQRVTHVITADRRGSQQPLRSLRTLGFFAGRRAIDIKILADLRKRDSMFFYRHAGPTDLKRGCFSDVALNKRNAPRI